MTRRKPKEEKTGIEESAAHKSPKQPKFNTNFVVTNVALVTDAYGQAWWVDPFNKILSTAESKPLTKDGLRAIIWSVMAEFVSSAQFHKSLDEAQKRFGS